MNTGRIEVTRVSEDGLSGQTWTFYVSDRYSTLDLLLDVYLEQSRETKRHKMKTDRIYSRLSSGRSNFHAVVPIEEVPFPEDVQAEAREQMIANIRVVKAYER